MTEDEIKERLEALPYDIPDDIEANYVESMLEREMFWCDGSEEGRKEVERQFWERLLNASPDEQQKFFKAARAAGSKVRFFGWLLLCAIIFTVHIFMN